MTSSKCQHHNWNENGKESERENEEYKAKQCNYELF